MRSVLIAARVSAWISGIVHFAKSLWLQHVIPAGGSLNQSGWSVPSAEMISSPKISQALKPLQINSLTIFVFFHSFADV